ncbi:nucleoside transporter-domain-containing protein [Suillus paluster]|uniref:nucleoside transporter-domain-containing protein n=1 Tax=Suillus paluster TaxID=48578 RepID=UPI001B8659BD|nr:nucleoside transporter-domain-containing protein [Suillus paluster]KAG1753737.1 nucleoside transporter-domain-containing protein [Suillus paluster]
MEWKAPRLRSLLCFRPARLFQLYCNAFVSQSHHDAWQHVTTTDFDHRVGGLFIMLSHQPQAKTIATTILIFAVDDFGSDISITDQTVDSRIWWIYFMLGCATLLPWNALITATSFFLSRLVGSPLRETFTSYMTTISTVFNIFAVAHATATSKRSSPSQRVVWSTASTTLVIVLLFLSTFVHYQPSTFFFFAILCSILLAIFVSYLSTAAFAGASLFGAPYMQSVISGQAAIGVVVSVVQVATSALSVWGSTSEAIATFISNDGVGDGKAEEDSARAFFGISAIFMISTFIAYAWMARLSVYIDTVGILEQNAKLDGALDSADEMGGLVFRSTAQASLDERNQILRVFKANIIYEFAVAYVYVVTLAVFPVITITIQPTNPNTHPLLFSAIHFLMFNFGDFFGRYICSFPRVITWSAARILVFSIVRTLFIPIFLLCNTVQGPSHDSPVISSDIVYMLLVGALGLSNGYVSTLCMLGASSLEHNPRLRKRREDVPVASTVAGFCLIVGVAIGSFGSFGVRAIVCQCNPFVN